MQREFEAYEISNSDMKKEKTTTKPSTVKRGRPSKKKSLPSSTSVEVKAAVEPQQTCGDNCCEGKTAYEKASCCTIMLVKSAVNSLIGKFKKLF